MIIDFILVTLLSIKCLVDRQSPHKRSERQLMSALSSSDLGQPELNAAASIEIRSPLQTTIPKSTKKAAPNFFLAFRLTDPPFINQIVRIQQDILVIDPKLSKCLTPTHKLHFTAGFVMTLQSNTEIEEAQQIFQSCEPEVLSLVSAHVDLFRDHDDDCHRYVEMSKLDSFGTRVLFASPSESCKGMLLLCAIQQLLQSRFAGRFGVDPVRTSDQATTASENKWSPHATIAKLSADRRNGHKLKLSLAHFAHLSDRVRGLRVPISCVELLAMGQADRETGYYRSYGRIDLFHVPEEHATVYSSLTLDNDDADESEAL